MLNPIVSRTETYLLPTARNEFTGIVLQIIDAKDRIVEDTSIDSFISGFELAWQLSMELNNYKNERLASCRTGRLGARFTSEKEEPK